jgi:chromosomal replication initiator protein
MMKTKRGFNFDNFYVYDGNRVAYLAGQKIIQFPGELFNPFYVYSATGLGKTHLLWAIHAELSKRSNILLFTANTRLRW